MSQPTFYALTYPSRDRRNHEVYVFTTESAMLRKLVELEDHYRKEELLRMLDEGKVKEMKDNFLYCVSGEVSMKMIRPDSGKDGEYLYE